MTTGEVARANCAAIWLIREAIVYAHGMGTIIRCPSGDHALIRFACSSGATGLT
jgi:hypothetical protein